MELKFTVESCVEESRNAYISLFAEKLAESLVLMEKEPVFSVSKMQEAVAAAVAVLQEADVEDDIMERRGRKKIRQLLGCYRNIKVCSWFDKIRNKLKRFIDSLKELLTCFFCALFDITSSDGYGKETCFYEMIKAHLQEKIPSMSTFQKAVKWFKGWRVEVLSWKNKKAEEGKHRLWERLCQKIKEELLRLEPQLAMAY